KTNHNFINKIMNEDFYHKHKNKTELNDLLSVLGTIEMGEATLDWFDKHLENNLNMQKQLDKIENVSKKLKQEQIFNTNTLHNTLIDELNNIMEEFSDSMLDMLNEHGDELSNALNKALNEAEETEEKLEG